MQLLSFHVTHQWAPPELVRRAVTVPAKRILRHVKMMEGVVGCAALITCHRSELYVETNDLARVAEQIRAFFAGRAFKTAVAGSPSIMRPTTPVRVLEGTDTVRQLFRVAAGLDSKIVGETEILGQVRQAFNLAKEQRTLSPRLVQAFQKSLELGRIVRTQPDYKPRRDSYAAETVDLLQERLGDLHDKRIAIIGAGALATNVCRQLRSRGDSRITILNRSSSTGRRLAQTFNAEFSPLRMLRSRLSTQDAAIVAVNVERPIVVAGQHSDALQIIVDLSAVPAVSPKGARPEIVRLDHVVNRIADRNPIEAPVLRRVSNMVDEAANIFVERQRTGTGAGAALRRLAERVQAVHDQELVRANAKLAHLSARDRKIVDDMVRSIQDKLLQPVARFFSKNADATHEASTLERVFDLNAETS